MSKLPFFERFRTRLSLLIILLVVPAFGLVLYSNLAQRRIQTAGIRDRAKGLSELAAANQQDIIKNARQLLGTLTQFPFLVLASNRPFCEFHFSNLLKLSPDYVNFGLIESNGFLFCSGATTNASANLIDRSYVRGVIQNGKFSTGEFQIGRLTGEPSLNFGYPVLDEHGALRRVVFSSVKISKLSESMAHIRLPSGGTIMVLDRNGQVLAHEPAPEKWVGKSLSESPVVRNILACKEQVFTMPGIDSVPRLHAVTSISDGQSPAMFVCVSIPVSVSMAQATQTLVGNCIVLALVALVVLAGASFYSQRFFLRPVNVLVDTTKALAAGNLGARAGRMEGAAELVQLGKTFDEMAQRLEERQAELLKVNETLKAEVAERQRAEQRIREQAEEQKNLEQQFLRAQRMESLGALAGGIAHDLNNALAPIIMGSELLRESAKGDPERLSFLDLIVSSAQRCTQMVKQIVNFAKGSPNKNGLVKVPGLVQEMVKLTTDTFPKSISIHSQAPDSLFTVAGDPTELHQVLMNLCVNARDAMPQGGQLSLNAKNVTISAEDALKNPNARPGLYVQLSVTDTGAGIAPDTLKRIFEPFFTTKTPDKGTGLGLSTVAHIVSRHKGFVEVQSKMGEGTSFDIFLPATESNQPEQAKEKPTILPMGKGELILIVDDEQMVLQLAKTTLENYGYKVVTARNGLEAIACFDARKSEIRLLVTDTDMPFLNGVEAIEAIQKLKPQLPIIMASGIQRETGWSKRIDTSHLSTLNKPYGVEQLLEAVVHVLEVRGPEQHD